MSAVQNRDLTIDYMKSILVIGMVFAHVIAILNRNHDDLSFVGRWVSSSFFWINEWVNLITFHSFLFCFGYTYQLAYLGNHDKPKSRILKGAYRVLIAYYICAFTSYFLSLPVADFSASIFFDILIFNKIPGFCEFLLAFVAISLLCFVFYKAIVAIVANKYILIAASVLLLSLSLIIPYDLIPNQLGVFIGTNSFHAYPLFQYFPFFLLGAYIAKNGIGFNSKLFVICLLLSLIGAVFFIAEGIRPELLRFPPSFFWLILPSVLVYWLYLISRMLSSYNLGSFFSRIGSNTIIYLMFSNIALFAISSHAKDYCFAWYEIIMITVGIFFAINYTISTIKR